MIIMIDDGLEAAFGAAMEKMTGNSSCTHPVAVIKNLTSRVDLSTQNPGVYRPLRNGKPIPIKVAATVGRNDRCPCGSGRKYKKCCLN